MGTSPSKQPPPSSFESHQEDWPWVWGIRDASHLDWKVELSSNDEIQAQALRQLELPVPITDNLYLGNAASVQAIHKLEELGITSVLNMAGPMALRKKTIQAYQRKGITYRRIDAQDELDYPLLQNHWQEAFGFIQSTIHNNGGEGKCVVHCVAGMNRSALVVAAFYMLTTKMERGKSWASSNPSNSSVLSNTIGYSLQQPTTTTRENPLDRLANQ